MGSKGSAVVATDFLGILRELSVLGRIIGGFGFDELASRAVQFEVEVEGVGVLVQDLEGYIAVKEALGGEKDLAQLPVLRRTLEETRRERGPRNG